MLTLMDSVPQMQQLAMHHVSLQWNADSDAVNGYFVYQKTGSWCFVKPNLTAQTATTYSDPNVKAHETYAYQVTAEETISNLAFKSSLGED